MPQAGVLCSPARRWYLVGFGVGPDGSRTVQNRQVFCLIILWKRSRIPDSQKLFLILHLPVPFWIGLPVFGDGDLRYHFLDILLH
jgi:hypothetical protein